MMKMLLSVTMKIIDRCLRYWFNTVFVSWISWIILITRFQGAATSYEQIIIIIPIVCESFSYSNPSHCAFSLTCATREARLNEIQILAAAEDISGNWLFFSLKVSKSLKVKDRWKEISYWVEAVINCKHFKRHYLMNKQASIEAPWMSILLAEKPK